MAGIRIEVKPTDVWQDRSGSVEARPQRNMMYRKGKDAPCRDSRLEIPRSLITLVWLVCVSRFKNSKSPAAVGQRLELPAAHVVITASLPFLITPSQVSPIFPLLLLLMLSSTPCPSHTSVSLPPPGSFLWLLPV